MVEPEHEIVAFGATGFTGGLAAEYLAASAPPGTRWAVAGRNERKLAELVDRLSAGSCPPRGYIVASVDDAASLASMTRSTRVLMSTVGPFEQYGAPVVAACVASSTDYVDITGEPSFVDRMIERHHTEAERERIKIVSCCGFDSIPHDLGVLYTLAHLPPGEPTTIRGFVRSSATFSGGTWHSAVHAMSKVREHAAARKARPRKRASHDRRVRGLRPRVYYERTLKAWAAPLPTIDPQIVLRSARLCDAYGPDFQYGHHARVENLSTLVGGGIAISSIAALAQLRPTRELLLRVRARGDGPSEAKRARSWFDVTFLGEAGGQKVMTQVSGGDPGYTETAKMVSESALCLALQRAQIPDRYGVITTAAAMGQPLIERLQRAGIAFRLLSERSAGGPGSD